MDTVAEDKDIQSQPIIRFNNGISLSDLVSGKGSTFEVKLDEDFTAPENEDLYNSDIFKYSKFECLSLNDEDTYNDTEPFQHLAEKMTDLTPDGKIKKRILREGVGNILPENGYVTCDFNAYIEYNEIAFDSTYARNKPFKFTLGTGMTIPGLDIAVQSMKINEKSQFLIHPDLAYGKMGCLSRVPPDTTVLFEVEVKNCLNTGAIGTYENAQENEQDFPKTREYALALCSKGNDFFKRGLVKQAIKEYNIAVSKLEKCVVSDYSEQEEQEALLLRLYTNLVVAYTKLQVPKKACSNANALFHMVKGTALKVPVKVYFNNARSLMMLGDYDQAKQKLQIAKRLEPKNTVIGEEFLKLDTLMKESREREKNLAKKIFSITEVSDSGVPTEEVTEEFKETLKEYFEELMHDDNHTQYNLPDKMLEIEINYIKENALKYGLVFGETNGKYFICKNINQD